VRRPATALAALLSAALLSSCSTGLNNQTYQPRTPADSTSAQVGDLALRGFAVELDPEGPPLVVGVVVNQGTEGDALVGATTPVAPTVQYLSQDGAPNLDLPPGRSSGSTWALLLDGMAEPLVGGTFIDVTLEFAKAGKTTISVPVRPGDLDLANREELRDPYEH
jgi:copper(I)-binding protein